MGIEIRLEGIRVQKGGREVLAVDELVVRGSEVWALIGPNGAGKSTLLEVMALLEEPDRGRVFYDGHKIDYRRALFWRRRMAVVFQEALLLDTTVFNNVALGLRFRGYPRSVIKDKVEHWLEVFRIGNLADRPARCLSGGEAQRVSLARAFVLEPQVLFLDEPFAALDLPTRSSLIEELHYILRQTGITAVFVTHDFTELPFLADHVAALQGGRIIQCGTPGHILRRPASIELAGLVGISNILPGEAWWQGGTVRVRLQGGVTLMAGTRLNGRVVACLRPEEITLQAPDTSAPVANVLRGRIRRIVPRGSLCRIELDCGIPLVAETGIHQLRQEGFSPGKEVLAAFPPDAVHLIPA
ncbi:MAG: ABC transporter ATP-binding protein [Moorella sp. (in: firmicutes)]